MKAEIIQRLKGPNFGQIENTNNFHNLYVQRHTNVRHVNIYSDHHFHNKEDLHRITDRDVKGLQAEHLQ